MLPLLIGLAAVGGLVKIAIDKVTGPSKKPYVEQQKLESLKAKRTLTLNEAEDGLVLARRYRDKKAEVRFAIEVGKLRKKRVPI
jgi:hypothetical protein